VRRHELGLALRSNGIDSLDLDRVASELERRVAEDDLAGLRSLLQSGGHVHGVAGNERVTRPCHDLACVDAYARVQAKLDDGFAELHRRAQSAQRIVLMEHGYAEDGHHGVADELLDGAAVALERGPRTLEVPRLESPQSLGVELVAGARVSREVAEDDGDDLADVPCGFVAGRHRRKPTDGLSR
jgi:hypothetical protein